MSAGTTDKKLMDLLYTDDLTHIYNRRYLSEQIPRELSAAKKKSQVIAFFMFDMDNFKGINDSYGHQVGDEALVHFAGIIMQEIKPRGTAIRYAGDEFILLVPELDKKKARHLGTEIQKKIADSPLKVEDKQLTLGCSVGVSLFPKDGKTWKTLFRKADEALYEAKYRGKGRVVFSLDSGKFLIPSKLDSILESPPLAGRDAIVQFLEKHLSRNGNPLEFPVFLGGDGLGKTRLMKHASEVARRRFAFTLSAKGYPFWQTEMYGSVFAALGSLFEHDPSLSDEVFSRLEDNYKLILKPHLYPWEVKEVKAHEEGIESDRTALFEALTQTFFILHERGDGAVLLDDADQMDPASLQFFDSQFKQENGSRLFFVSSITSPDLTAGEEKLLLLLDSMPEVAAKGALRRFQLEPLLLEQVQQLVAKLFDGKALSNESAEVLLRNSAGNPLFIVETLSFLLQEGKIEPMGDEWNLSLVKAEDIPISLSDLIKERLMRMDKEAVDVLKLASILGEKINPHQLAEMSKLKLQQVLNILDNARRLLLIEETPNTDEFIFAHRKARSVFYSLMSEDERRDYHALAAEIEKKYAAASLERVVGRLAYHFQNAGQLDRAAKMLSTMKNQREQVYISKGSRKTLQKRILAASMAKESPLEDEDLSRAPKLGLAFRSAIQNLRLYPKDNENVKNSVERLLKILESFLASKTEALSLSFTPETILLNGQPVPPKSVDLRLTQDLHTDLSNYGLQGILFLRGINRDEVMRFLELFTRAPEEVSSMWDELIDQLELSSILPDRKIFVMVSERKVVLDKQEVLALSGESTSDGVPVHASTDAPRIPDEQIEQLKSIVDQFAKEKQELLSALGSAEVDKQDFQKLMDLLSHTDFSRIEKIMQQPEAASASFVETPHQKDTYADVLPDLQLVKETEQHISLAFEDLNSKDTATCAKAAAWLVTQEPARLGAAGLKAVTSEAPLRARRLAAAVINKAGKTAEEAFLEKINSGMPVQSILNMLMVADVFIDNPMLVPVLREIVLLGPAETVRPALEILKQIPGKEANSVLLELFDLAIGKAELDILTIFAERKTLEAVPSLSQLIKPKRIWQEEERILLQAQACKTLGMIGSSAAREALIAAVQFARPLSFLKTKPDSVRAAAVWALRQLPPDEKINKVVDALKKDKSPLIRKIARE